MQQWSFFLGFESFRFLHNGTTLSGPQRKGPCALRLRIGRTDPRCMSSHKANVQARYVRLRHFTVASRKRHRDAKSATGAGETNVPDIDAVTASEEFKLLCRLFTPQGGRRTISKDRLMQRLPRLVGASKRNASTPNAATTDTDPYDKLNFELHLLLATIVSRYIDLWYSSKLNTDNLDFIEAIYQTLSHVTAHICSQCRSIWQKDPSVSANEAILILNRHIRDFIEVDFNLPRNSYNDQPLDADGESQRHLAAKHIIFTTAALDPDRQQVDDNRGQPLQEALYFRAMSREIITTLLTDDHKLSPISEGLVVAILGDVVFVKALESLSNPTFILGLVRRCCQSLASESNPPAKRTDILGKNVSGVVRLLYAATQTVHSWVRQWQSSQESTCQFIPPNPDSYILNSPIFELCDTVTQFSVRKPMLKGMLQLGRHCIMSSTNACHWVEAGLRRCLHHLVDDMMSDDSLAAIIASLRVKLFSIDEPPQQPAASPDINEIAAEILCLGDSMLPATRPHLFQSGEDLLLATVNILSIFASSHARNKLLIVQWIDLLVATIFPQLVHPA